MPDKTSFQPELGQMVFSNGRFAEHAVPERVSDELHVLAGAIADARGDEEPANKWGGPYAILLTANYGAEEYTNDVFVMRTYCWCDGDKPGHEDGCPPNFEHLSSGLQINWYKHAGRGANANRELTRKLWAPIFRECLASVPSE